MASGRGRPRAIVLGALGLALVAAALALTGRLRLAGLLDDGPLAALLSLVQRS